MRIYARKGKDGKECWYIDYGFDGMRVRRRVGYGERGRVTAERKSIQIKVEMEAGTYQVSKKTKVISFKDFINSYYKEYIQRKKSYPQSGSFFLTHLVDFFGNIPMHKITYSMVEKYCRERSKTSPVSANREMSLLRAIFNKAQFLNQRKGMEEQKWRLPATNPVKGVEFNREESRTRFANDVEIEKLLEPSPLNTVPYQKLADIILLTLNTGLRKGEVQKLSVERDVDWVLNVITLPDTKSKSLGSTNQSQKIPMNQIARRILSKYKIEPDEYPFNYNFRKCFDNVVEDAKIKGLHFHDLRRTFAVLLRRFGVDIFTVSKLLRHSTPDPLKVTAIYTPMLDQELHDAVRKLEDYFSKVGTNVAQTPNSVSDENLNDFYNLNWYSKIHDFRDVAQLG